jgi:uracil-DNA glycosylase
MMIPRELRSLLIPIHKGLRNGKCPCGVFADLNNGWIPRIMVGAENGLDAVRLIIVGKNPGHPVSEEAELYRSAISRAKSEGDEAELLFDAMVKWGEKCLLYSIPGRQGVYHRRLMNFLREVLGVSTNKEVLKQVYFTQLMKCSTPHDEQAKLKAEVARTCINNWLTKELRFLPTVPIVALGRETEKFLREISDEIASRTVYLSHPSWPMKNYELAKRELRDKLSNQ